MISLQAKWIQIGADGHLIGSLLYLVGVASWFSDLTEIEGLEIGWALAVGLAGENLTLTRPIGLPPHALVAQKIADQR